MYYVLCNVETGSVLDVSSDILNSDGYPTTVRVMEGDIPNPLTHSWDRVSMTYVNKQMTLLSHIQFRKLFTPIEEISVDTFNDTYQSIAALTDMQKAMIRTGLKKYAEAQGISLNDSGVSMLLDLYVAVGVITADRKQEILNGEFKQ